MLKGVTSGGGGITPGTTVITAGTNTRVLFDDNGVVGESAGLTYVKASGTLTGTAVVGGNLTDSALSQYQVVVAGAAGLLSGSSSLTMGGAAAGTGLVIASGTPTTAVGPLTITETRNTVGTTYPGIKYTITDTTSAAGSLAIQILGGATGTTILFSVDKNGAASIPVNGALAGFVINPGSNSFTLWQGFNQQAYFGANFSKYAAVDVSGVFVLSTGGYRFSSSGSDSYATQSGIGQASANSLIFGGSSIAAGGAATRTEINKNVTAIADNVATATVTITVPNAAHSAGGRIIIKAVAGTGGAIGADEFSVVNEYDWVVTRTAGVNAVATLTAVITGVAASVAGGATVTLTAVFSAISGAVGATNTFTLNVTIAHGSGSSTNHTCFVYGTLLNDNASGVTIA